MSVRENLQWSQELPELIAMLSELNSGFSVVVDLRFSPLSVIVSSVKSPS
jgi:hypothetical protein